jgi:hypothetical protein
MRSVLEETQSLVELYVGSTTYPEGAMKAINGAI